VRVLFVCRGNVCRSRVAEEIFRVLSWSLPGRRRYEARSAGVAPDPGGRLVTAGDVQWADVICAMEAEHGDYLRRRWPLHGHKIRVLGIPDVYQPDDEALRGRLVEVVRGLLAEGAPGPAPDARARSGR
jgi:protein-tyrosine-phosphatase